MESLIIKAQGILANRLKPDGISAADTIDQLLGLLDGPSSGRRNRLGHWLRPKEGHTQARRPI